MKIIENGNGLEWTLQVRCNADHYSDFLENFDKYPCNSLLEINKDDVYVETKPGDMYCDSGEQIYFTICPKCGLRITLKESKIPFYVACYAANRKDGRSS